MRDRSDELATHGLDVLGVSFDTIEENQAFATKYGFPFKLLCDTGRELGLAYGAARSADEGYARRISYLIVEQGKILRAYAKVKPDEHLDTVLKDLSS